MVEGQDPELPEKARGGPAGRLDSALKVWAAFQYKMVSLGFKKAMLLAFLCGLTTTLAMPPLFLWPLLFLTLPPLVWLIDSLMTGDNAATDPVAKPAYNSRQRLLRLAGLGWSFGFGHLLVSLYWIGSSFLVEADKFAWALPFAVTLLPAALAIFYSAAFTACGLYWPKGPERLIVFAIAIFAVDWLRGHIFTGFPWNLIGHSLTSPDYLMQSLSLFGLYGLSALAVLIFAAPATLFRTVPNHSHSKPIITPSQAAPSILALIMLCALFGYGALRLTLAGPTKFTNGVELVLIQPNVPQKQKVDPAQRTQVLQRAMNLTATTLANAAPRPKSGDNSPAARLIIWPETAVPFALNQVENLQKTLAEYLQPGDQLITGAYNLEGTSQADARAYNSLFLIDPPGTIAAKFDKHHLVPFGEYLPFPEIFSAIGFEALVRMRGGFAIGPPPRPIKTAAAPPFLPFICYEAIFPFDRSEAGTARWLLNISNDGWFGHTAGPHQHAHFVRLRTVETGLPMVRLVNGGISAVYDGLGRTVTATQLGEAKAIFSALPQAEPGVMSAFSRALLFIFLLSAHAGIIRLMKNFDKRREIL